MLPITLLFRMLPEVLQSETKIDILINNAGMGMVGAVEDSTKEDILNCSV
jgi:short-subunit dehydrogenase